MWCCSCRVSCGVVLLCVCVCDLFLCLHPTGQQTRMLFPPVLLSQIDQLAEVRAAVEARVMGRHPSGIDSATMAAAPSGIDLATAPAPPSGIDSATVPGTPSGINSATVPATCMHTYAHTAASLDADARQAIPQGGTVAYRGSREIASSMLTERQAIPQGSTVAYRGSRATASSMLTERQAIPQGGTVAHWDNREIASSILTERQAIPQGDTVAHRNSREIASVTTSSAGFVFARSAPFAPVALSDGRWAILMTSNSARYTAGGYAAQHYVQVRAEARRVGP